MAFIAADTAGASSRTIGLVLLTFQSIGMTVGSSSVDLLTDHVFGDPLRVGWSLAVVFAATGPAGFLCFLLSYKAANRTRYETKPQWMAS